MDEFKHPTILFSDHRESGSGYDWYLIQVWNSTHMLAITRKRSGMGYMASNDPEVDGRRNWTKFTNKVENGKTEAKTDIREEEEKYSNDSG